MLNNPKRYLGVVCVCLLGMIIPTTAKADTHSYPDIQVTATNYPESLYKSGYSVQVLTSEDIDVLGIRSIDDALNYFSGINVINAGGTRTLFVNGTASNRVIVKLDGISLNDPASPQGTPFLSALDINTLDRIEFFHGGGGVAHGSGGIGGVIQLFTSSNSNRQIDVDFGDDYKRQSAYVGGTLGDLSYAVGATHVSDERLSKREGDEADLSESDTSFIRAAYSIGNAKISGIHHHITSKDDLDKNGTNSQDPDYVNDTTQQLTAITLESPLLTDHTHLHVRYSQSDVERVDTDPTSNAFPFSFESTFFGQRKTWEARIHHEVSEGISTIIGGEHYEETANNSFGFSDTINGDAKIAQLNINHSLLNIRFGNRWESLNGNDHYVYDVSFFRPIWNTDIIAKANVRSGFREPTLFELFSFFGNKELLPEQTFSREYSLAIPFGFAHWFTWSVYEHDIRDQIIFGDNRYEQESGKTQNWGQNIRLDFRRVTQVVERFTIDVSLTDEGSKGNIRVPDHKTVVTAWLNTGPFKSGLTVINRGRMVDSNDVELEPFTVVNLNFMYPIDAKSTMIVTIENVLDVDYQQVDGFETLGRHLVLGFRSRF